VWVNEYFLASDASAILAHTRQVVYLDDGDLAVLTPDGYKVIDINAIEIRRRSSASTGTSSRSSAAATTHFMLKEIFEQPTTVENTMRGRLIDEEGTSKLGGLNITHEELISFDNIVITACGTLALGADRRDDDRGAGAHPRRGRVRVGVPLPQSHRHAATLCIVISQSGETADTLAAMREAKRRGARTLGLVNVVGSTIAREDDGGVYLHAGPEIGVASTKAFTSQVIALALFTLKLGRLRTLSQ
jgi:glucosamine--fructose-6-phosphate aminotransferase (isomerizing)